MATRYNDGTDIDELVIDLDKTYANPTVIGSVAIQIAGDGFTPQEPLHIGFGFATVSIRSFRCVDTVQANRRPSNHNGIGIANIGSSSNLPCLGSHGSETRDYHTD